jgi:intracellular septation protein A
MLATAERFVLPTPRQLLGRAMPHAIETAIIPAALFVVVSAVFSTSVAIVAALAWALACAARRLVAGRRVPGMTILAAVTLLGRSLVALAAGGSAFLYFLQPAIGGFLLAGAFILSVLLDRPLVRSFANDFVTLPSAVSGHTLVHRFFRRASVMWGTLAFANATATLWLLTTQSTGVYVVLRTLLSIGWNAAAIVISVVWFRRTMAATGALTTS